MQSQRAMSTEAANEQLISDTAKRLAPYLRKIRKLEGWTVAKCRDAVKFMVDVMVLCRAAATESNVWQEIVRRVMVLQVPASARVRKDARAGIKNILAQITLHNPGGFPADVLAAALLYYVGTRSVQLYDKWPFYSRRASTVSGRRRAH
jgi:hypothetical protein